MKTILPIVLLAANIALAAPPADVVRTDGGLIQGTSEGGLKVYRGIPFAAPPLGQLRWVAPQPARPWSGVRAADRFASSCIQTWQPDPELGTPPLTLSEDCLYLNVWTPAKTPRDGLPVMVWIYGGGFNEGSTAIPFYSGEQLAQHGVVVVSIAYRLGPLGFLAHPALSAESEHHASGNYGLLDQIAGLQWVRRNIAAFGGDARRVTIFGESAGGISVSMLAASPVANGLFHGAISESGGSFGGTRRPPLPGENMLAVADAERDGVAFAERLGAHTGADLRKLSAEALQNAGSQVGLFWPVVDGWVIAGDQYKLYEAGRYNDTPVLIGTNSDEGVIFGAAKSPEAYVAATHARFGPYADRLLKLYPPNEGYAQSSMDLIRDAAFAWHNWAWARLQAASGKSKVFLYYFDHRPPRPERSPWKNATGAVHSEEMAYVFQHLDRNLSWTTQDRALADAVADYWTNFAKYGDPNGAGLPSWPAFTAATQDVMRFTDAPHAGALPNLQQLKVLDAYFAWRRTHTGAD